MTIPTPAHAIGLPGVHTPVPATPLGTVIDPLALLMNWRTYRVQHGDSLSAFALRDGRYAVCEGVSSFTGGTSGITPIFVGHVDQLHARVGDHPLARALYHHADLPVPQRVDVYGLPDLTVLAIRAYAFARLAAPGFNAPALRGAVAAHRAKWDATFGTLLPTLFDTPVQLHQGLLSLQRARVGGAGAHIHDLTTYWQLYHEHAVWLYVHSRASPALRYQQVAATDSPGS